MCPSCTTNVFRGSTITSPSCTTNVFRGSTITSPSCTTNVFRGSTIVGAPSQAQAVPPNLPHAPPAPLQHPLPPVAPIGIHNVPGPAGQSGHLLYGPLVPQNDEDQLLSGRQPAIVMYNRMIQKCFTCEVDFDPNFMCAPHNMVIRSKTRRWRIFNGQKIRCKTYTNVYYCIDNLACVRKQLPGTVKNHMYMGNFYFQSLTPGHKEVLQEYGYWNNILRNRDEVI